MKINNQSDFKIKEVTKNEDFNVRFRFEFFVYEFKKYVVSWDGKEYVNCKRLDDGSLEIIFNNPKFGLGQLKVRREYYISDEDFIDGIWNAVTVEKTGIYITDGETDDIDVENVIVPPYIKGEPGKDMKWSTMTQDEKDELINDLGEGINNSFVEAETTRNNNEELRKTSESARVTAEQGRVEAELKRGTDFDTLKSEMQTAIDEGKAATKETIAATEGLDAIVEEQNAKLTELGSKVEDVEQQINGDVFFNSVPKMRMNILPKPIPQGSYYILTTDDTSRPYYLYYGTSDSDEYITAKKGAEVIAEKDIFAVYAGFKDVAPSDVLTIKGIKSIKEDIENLYLMSGGIKRCEIVPYEKKIDFTIVDGYLKMVVPKDTLIRTFDSSWYVPSDIEVTFTDIIIGTVYFTIYYDASTHTFGAVKYNQRIPDGCFFVCNYNRYSFGTSLPLKYYTVNGVDEIKGIKEDINSIKGDIEEIKSNEPSTSDILTLNPADSVGQRIIQSYRRTNLSRTTLSIKPNLVMSIITDLHADRENLERWFEFNTKYGTYITQQIQLGDIVADKFEDDYTFYTENTNTDNVLCAIGNHDVRKYFEDGKFDDFSITGIEAYEKYLKPFEQKWMSDCVFPDNAASKGFCYYYKDYTIQHDYNAVSPSYAKYKSAGIRVVVTDTNNIDTEQITWLRNVLSDAITNKFSVLIFRHYPMGSLNRLGNFNTIDFADYGIPYAPNTANQQMIDEVDNFINNGGEFICWITGDTHYDIMGTLKKSSNEQLIMSFENGGASAIWNDSERVRGQKSQDSFNIVSVDTFSKLLKVVRVGNDCDRYLRSKKSIVIRYDNKEIVSEL